METIEFIWTEILNLGIATESELCLITGINGYSIESLNDVIFARTGYRSYSQLIESFEDE